MRKEFFFLIIIFLFIASVRSPKKDLRTHQGTDTLRYPEEKHLANMRQLTFGADNAEAYWSFDGTMISFQSNNPAWGLHCDQIFYMPVDGLDLRDGRKPPMVSTGLGRTTCSFFLPDNKLVLYASTHGGDKGCPKDVERTPGGKYLWPIYDTYDIYIAALNGKVVRQLTDSPGYDAEATISPTKDKIVFTSMRNGDLDLYTMDLDGKNVHQVTHELGYDGGAFFSPDGKKIVFRASRPGSDEEKKEYQDYLKQGLVAPTKLEIFTCNVGGSELKQITHLGKANWAPFYHPSGKKIIFSSNYKGTRGFQFNLFMIDEDGSNLEQITFDKTFDSFAMFSPNGKKIIFSSNRHNGGTHNTNLFVSDWVE
jgi:TolB protein